MEKGLQNMLAAVVGGILLLIGIVGYINRPFLDVFGLKALFNIVFLISGALLLWAGVWRSKKTARTMNKTIGIVYLVFTLLCLIAIAASFSVLNLLGLAVVNKLNTGMYLVIGLVLTGTGFFSK